MTKARDSADKAPVAAAAGTNTFTGAQNTARATVASHATTADIWAAAGNQINWTGTATTTAFPAAPQAGAERTLICAGACSFTAGANMLIDGVASAATVTCAANDKVIVRAISTTQFNLTRVKYDGTAQVVEPTANGLVWLSTVTASASATVDIETTFNSTYAEYLLVGSNVTVSNDAVHLQCRLKIGGAYLAGTEYYGHSIASSSSSSSYSGGVVIAGANLMLAYALGNADAAALHLRMQVSNPSSTTRNKVVSFTGGMVQSTGDSKAVFGQGHAANTAALTGVRFLASAGTLSGTFRLYGITNS